MQLRKDVIIFGVVCAILGAIVALSIGVLTYHPTTATEAVRTNVRTIVKTDTITLTDIITTERIKHHYSEVIKRDTIRQDTILLTERKGYSVEVNNDSIRGEIFASVSGVNPSLDSLSYRFNIPTKTITQTIETERIIKQKTHFNYGVGVGAGYGLINRQADIYVGAFIGYSF